MTLRIGLVVSGAVPSGGGSYTFEATVLEQFFQAHHTTCWHWLVISNSDSIARRCREHGISHFNPYPSRLRRVWLGLRTRVARLSYLLKHGVPAPMRESSWLQRHIDRELCERVHLLWHLHAGNLSPVLPSVLTVWDVAHRATPFFPELLQTWDMRETVARYVQAAAAVVVGTDTGKQELKRYYGLDDNKIKVIPFPVPSCGEMHDQRDASGEIFTTLGISQRYALYPAQFWPHKNHANVVRAMRQLRDQGHCLQMVFTGSDKGNLSFIRQLIERYDLQDQVVIAGFVSPSDLQRLYEKAFCLCYASFIGPDNLPPLEAMAMGLPVAAADVPGAREQLGDAALLFDPASSDAIAGALRRLLGSRDIRRQLVADGNRLIAAKQGESYIHSVFAVVAELEPRMTIHSARHISYSY